MKQQILPPKMKHELQKVDKDRLQDQKKKKKNQKPTLNPPIETKNKLKIEMDSTPTFKRPGELKQKAQASIGQAERVNMNTEVFSERPGGTFKLPPAKFDAVPSSSRVKLPMGIDKQSNAQGTSESLQRSYSIESMDSNTDRIVASLNLEAITNNYKTWNHLTKKFTQSFLKVTYKPST